MHIKKLNPGNSFKASAREKTLLKKKWELLSLSTAYRLNRLTNHWKQAQQKTFLAVFCGGFLLLLVLSFYSRENHTNTGHTPTVSKLPENIITPEKQTGKNPDSNTIYFKTIK